MSSEIPRTATEEWKWRRREVIIRDEYTCLHCGAEGGPKGDSQLHVHHIVPAAEGGSDDLQNLKTLCKPCHDRVHGRLPEQKLVELFDEANVPAYHYTNVARKFDRARSTIQTRLLKLVENGVLDGSKNGVYYRSPVRAESIKKAYPGKDILVNGRPVKDGEYVDDGGQYFLCDACGGAYTTRSASHDISTVRERHLRRCDG